MGLIFTASASSDPGLPSEISDKTAHFAAYALLSALFLRAFAGGALAAVSWPRALAAILLSVLYGVTDELHQTLVPQRSPEVLDVAADALGACGGALFVMIVKWVREALKPVAGRER
ncbi:MAG TPA: VanZ family protein [Vicinamibacterales bacterium]|nr:VanZ family protein [Vicinamibacterales bacterium]